MGAIILLILRFALAASLYAFLVWALITIWRGIKNQEAQLAINQSIPIRLTFEEDEEIKEVRLAKSEIILGRDSSCDCVLNDKAVSNKHACLSFHNKLWWLEDLGSTNGTFLNQELVSSPLVVTHGDKITCGNKTLTISLENQMQSRSDFLPT
jgi:pSer/pThr/pTyr-binding forkhead associated (FHA) protein